MSNSKKISVTKLNKTPFWVWLLALVPVLSSVIFLLILSEAIPFIELEIFYTNSSGELAWHTSGLLMLVLAIAGWGACGFLYGYFRAKMSVAVLEAHALPLACSAVYTFCLIVSHIITDSAPALAQKYLNAALMSSIGMGLFSYIDTFIYGFFPIGNFGLYVDMVFMIFAFIAGYTIGKSRRLKA
jgi:hypothetical protein